jgi:hypothetical protein
MDKFLGSCILVSWALFLAITLAFTKANADSSVDDGYYLGDGSQDVEPMEEFKFGVIDGEIEIIPGDCIEFIAEDEGIIDV